MAKDNLSIIQKLRNATGAGVMECKKALDESGGDLEKATAILRERGLQRMEKRAERATGAGIIASYLHNDRIGALVDLRAETDFVARSEPFRAIARELAMQVAAAAPADVEALLAQPYIKDESKSVHDVVNDLIARVGENIRVHAFTRLEI